MGVCVCFEECFEEQLFRRLRIMIRMFYVKAMFLHKKMLHLTFKLKHTLCKYYVNCPWVFEKHYIKKTLLLLKCYKLFIYFKT